VPVRSSFACGPFCEGTSGSRCDAAPGVASVVVSRRVLSTSGSPADVVLGSNSGTTICRVLRVNSLTHYRFKIWIFGSVTSNVNKPAPCSTICHLARKCRIAGSCHQDARSVQLPGRLIAQRNKVQIFRVDLLEPGVAKKTDRERKLEDSVGDRRAGGRCRKSRAANHVRGVRDPQSSLWVDCRTPWCLSSGAASLRGRRGARRFTVPFTVLPWSRNPSSSSEIEVIILH
jgi:hypothetical protein